VTIKCYNKDPVDLIVTDPDGLTVSKEVNEIPGATYIEVDLNGDGDPDDQITIPYRKIGDYLITVVPEPDASPDETYTLEITINGQTIVLAEDVPIGDIPDQPYLIQSTETEVNAAPIADADGPYTGFVGLPITFDATNSYDPDVEVVSYEWDLDDDGEFDDAFGPNPARTWDMPYQGNISLRVADDKGATSVDTTTVSVMKTIKTVGEPKYGSNDEWITSKTRFNLTVIPTSTYVNKTYYRIWYKGRWTPWMEYNGNFTLSGECKHYLEYYSTDYAGNQENIHNQTHFVDDTPPKTAILVGEPHVGDPGTGKPFFVTTHTPFNLSSEDGGECLVGVKDIYYRVWNIYTGWSNWTIYHTDIASPDIVPGFTLHEDCLHYIEYYAEDYLGNKEDVHNISCYVDDTPPITIGYGYYPIHLIARDLGWGECQAVGGYHIHYRHKLGDDGEWSEWFVGGLNEDITLWLPKPGVSPMGQPIYVDYYAVDILGNKEETHHDVFTREGNPYIPLHLVSPADGSKNVDINTNLRWSSNAQSYDIYFGKTTPPPLIVSGWTNTVYDPGTLDYGTTYYWRIVAHSKEGQLKESPVWSFTTAKKNRGDSNPGQNQPPQADFSFLPSSPKTGEEVFFQDESTDSDGDIVSWYWDFGDGTTSHERNPRHVYTQPGAYLITLSAEDNDGAEDTVYNSLVVIDTQEDNQNTTPLSIRIAKPEKAFYFNNKKILTTHTSIIIGSINIEAQVSDKTGVEKVEFYIDEELKATDTTKPYTWVWSEKTFGKHTIRVIAYSKTGGTATDKTVVTKFL